MRDSRTRSSTHTCVDVTFVEDCYVLECNCGWTSPCEPTAQAVGEAWDDHLERSS